MELPQEWLESVVLDRSMNVVMVRCSFAVVGIVEGKVDGVWAAGMICVERSHQAIEVPNVVKVENSFSLALAIAV